MDVEELFENLDFDADGELSRADLRQAVRRLEWGWPQAPLYAVLDALTIAEPLSRRRFAACLSQIVRDPMGPYGEVLRDVLTVSTPDDPAGTLAPTSLEDPDRNQATVGGGQNSLEEMVVFLETYAGIQSANGYQALAQRLGEADCRFEEDNTAVLTIDPQRSFTSGAWMQSIGTGADLEVGPIRIAFAHCARFLRERGHTVETVFTRCPFPPDSYDWDDPVQEVIGPSQSYFVKPGNSVLWPPTNGFTGWVQDLMARGKKTLVMAGCTLNSCVRVSAMETQERFGDDGLQVVVNLSLVGARTGNYVRSREFDGLSSVEHAVREMQSAGVLVVSRFV